MPSGTVTDRGLVQGEQIGALAFSPDGSRLAAGDIPEAVTALALSPDGRTLAVGGDSGALQLWDATTQQPLGGPLTTPGEKIHTLAFSPDSTTLYAGSAHVPLQRYTLAPAQVVTHVCARVGATLIPAQWHTYIPDAPDCRICGPADAR